MASDIGKKRKISEWDVSEIEETDMACVHGVPVVVSPLKKSRKNASLSYFHRKFGPIEAKSAKDVKIGELALLAVSQPINITAKVVSVEDVVLVTRKDGKELKKQDVNVADLSGCCHLVLWEGDVNKLEEGKSCRLVDVNVKIIYSAHIKVRL